MDSAIYLRVNFNLLDGHSKDEYTFVVTRVNSKGVEYTEPVEPKHKSDTRCYIDILDIAAAKLDHMYTITITHKETGEVYVVKDGVCIWIQTALTMATGDELNLAKAMYYYNQAANVYFNK